VNEFYLLVLFNIIEHTIVCEQDIYSD